MQEVYDALDLNMPYGAVSARVNNKVESLDFKVYNHKDVEFLDITSDSGMRTYVRTLFFVLSKAVSGIYPDGEVIIEHPISKGYFCNLHIGRAVKQSDVDAIKQRMQDIIDADMPIRRISCPTSEAIEAFRREGRTDVCTLLETTGRIYSVYYQLGDKVDYYYGSLLISTGKIHLFALQQYHDGLLLRVPSRENPDSLAELVRQDKMLSVFSEHHHWQKILGVSTVGDFNRACANGRSTELINVAEALQEKRIAHIADDIHRRGVRIVLIAGPSSSGKTTFSKRLSIQLMTCGLHPVALSLDDYFVDRELTPLDEHGQYDFESLYAVDLPYFNAELNALLRGEEVELPRFDFTTGKRVLTGKRLRIDDNTILILEGIHALNPELTAHIVDDAKYNELDNFNGDLANYVVLNRDTLSVNTKAIPNYADGGVKISLVDIPNAKRIEIALTYIYGIGRKSSNDILAKTGINPDTRAKDLTEAEIAKLRDEIENFYTVESDLPRDVAMNIKRKIEINCFCGIRHRKGLPVRGQRTKTNARTRKGPVKTIANKKK